MPVANVFRRISGRTGIRRGLNRLAGVPGALARLREELLDELRRELSRVDARREADREEARREREEARRERTCDPSFSARFFPYKPDQAEWLLPPEPEPAALDPELGLAVPPPDLWAGYGDSVENYLESGRIHVHEMFKVLRRTGYSLQAGHRVLDFGCAAGRMTRFFKSFGDACEVWGVDINAAAVLWCQQHLSPPFRFATSTTFPHLPFEDGSFDLIYSGSVFTHIADLSDTWLLELRRVLRPGGRMYLTVSDNHAIEQIMADPPGGWLYDSFIRRQLEKYEAREPFRSTGYGMFTVMRDTGNAQVFHHEAFLRRQWGRYLTVLDTAPGVYGYQTAVTLTKEAPPSAPPPAATGPAWDEVAALDLIEKARPFTLCAPEARRTLQEAGVHVEPAGFYSSIPTVDEIDASFEYQGDEPPFRDDTLFPPDRLAAFLGELDAFAGEFDPPRDGDPANTRAFFWDNGMFSCSDATAYYSMIRMLRPRRILELGCGHSTLVALEALERNGCGGITCVEPYPPQFFDHIAPRLERLVTSPAQDLSLEFFHDTLADGDVLFIDTTHTVKTGNDCVWLYLKILPYLRRKVMVHVHDIFLPRGYPKRWLHDLRYFWNEQYVLHALLLGNPKFEVCYGSAYHLACDRDALTAFMRGRAEPGGSSLWFRSLG